MKNPRLSAGFCAMPGGDWNSPRNGRLAGGRGGIRTRDTFYRMHAFQACALNRSATLPEGRQNSRRARLLQPLPAPESAIVHITCAIVRPKPRDVSGCVSSEADSAPLPYDDRGL